MELLSRLFPKTKLVTLKRKHLNVLIGFSRFPSMLLHIPSSLLFSSVQSLLEPVGRPSESITDQVHYATIMVKRPFQALEEERLQKVVPHDDTQNVLSIIEGMS